MTCRFLSVALVSAALLVPLVACEAQKSENPLSPSVAGPIAGVEITAPRLLQPSQGTKLKESQQPITLVVENSSTNGVRPIAYTFEVASDSAFETKMYARSGVTPGTDGRTTVTVDRLESGRDYYWRVRAGDGANSSPFANSNFIVLPRPQLDPPTQHAPGNHEVTRSRQPDLVVGVSARNAAIGNVVYEFQIGADVAFGSLASAGQRSEAGPTTSFAPDGELSAATTYFWRVRASDGDYTGNWSNVLAFRTPAAAGPPPGPGPGPTNPGSPCNSSSALGIVNCERAKYGFMSKDQILGFLRTVAQALNRNGIGGGPYGILRKESGNQCGGYSCDIICVGQGTSQLQYDVLGDVEGAQSPGWGSPHTYPGIRIDVCEIQ
ncbi:hypothetical protein BH24ACI5_BH24ACI5_15190 [soil metagenome]